MEFRSRDSRRKTSRSWTKASRSKSHSCRRRFRVERSLPQDANVFSNHPKLEGQEPGATFVILFDELNTSFLDQAYARQHVLRFLQSVKPQDRVAIFALTENLVVLHDFSEDAESLRNSVERFSPRLLAAFDASHPDNFHVPALANDASWKAFEDHVNNANGEIADLSTINRFQSTYAAIEAIAIYVAPVPGHKSLVWVSGGIPIQIGAGQIGAADRESAQSNSRAIGTSDARDLNGLAGILNRADMALYPIDAHGIDVSDASADFFTRQDLRDSSRLLADKTGGKAFYGTNDIARAMGSAVNDDRYTYTLGFYPNHGTWNGEFRKIKISLPIEGAHLRYRGGYFAFPRRSESEAARTDLQEAARSPLDATGLDVSVRVKPVAPSSDHLLQVQVTVDPKQFLLRDEDSRRKGGLDLLFLEKDAAGTFLVAEKQHFDVNFSRREYDSLAKNGLVLQRRLAINTGSSDVRILVRDAGSGTMGSVTIPVSKYLDRHSNSGPPAP
jgi:VWFA-related protein